MLPFLSPQLQASLGPVVRVSVWLVILVAIFVPLERFFAVHPQKVWRKGIGTDLGYYFLTTLLTTLLLGAPIYWLFTSRRA